MMNDTEKMMEKVMGKEHSKKMHEIMGGMMGNGGMPKMPEMKDKPKMDGMRKGKIKE